MLDLRLPRPPPAGTFGMPYAGIGGFGEKNNQLMHS